MEQSSIKDLISAKEGIDTVLCSTVLQDQIIEKKIIEQLLAKPEVVFTMIDTLYVDAFCHTSYKEIYEAIIRLEHTSKPIDIAHITSSLKASGKLNAIEDMSYLYELSKTVSEAPLLDSYVQTIHNNFLKRRFFEIGLDIQKQSLDKNIDTNSLLDFVNRESHFLTEMNINKPILKVNSILSQALDQIEKNAMDKRGHLAIPSGYENLDKITQGWQPSDLIVIAARPAMGKTSFALSMCRNIYLNSKKTIAYFSLELSSMQLTNRLISIETELPINKLQNGDLKNSEWEQLERKVKALDDAQLFIDDTSSISIFELQTKCRRLALESGDLNLIVVDYLQLLTTGSNINDNKEEEIDTIFRILKSIAKELNVPIIVLSQLSKSIDDRYDDKRPRLSDIQEYDAVEKHADMVLFLYRPEYYNITDAPKGNSLKGVAELIIAKHRNGKTGSVKLNFNKKLARFEDVK